MSSKQTAAGAAGGGTGPLDTASERKKNEPQSQKEKKSELYAELSQKLCRVRRSRGWRERHQGQTRRIPGAPCAPAGLWASGSDGQVSQLSRPP